MDYIVYTKIDELELNYQGSKIHIVNVKAEAYINTYIAPPINRHPDDPSTMLERCIDVDIQSVDYNDKEAESLYGIDRSTILELIKSSAYVEQALIDEYEDYI